MVGQALVEVVVVEEEEEGEEEWEEAADLPSSADSSPEACRN